MVLENVFIACARPKSFRETRRVREGFATIRPPPRWKLIRPRGIDGNLNGLPAIIFHVLIARVDQITVSHWQTVARVRVPNVINKFRESMNKRGSVNNSRSNGSPPPPFPAFVRGSSPGASLQARHIAP